MRVSTFLEIAQHDHTGSGSGSQLSTGSISADAITGAKIRLDNDEYLRSRNAADNANINLVKIDSSDEVVFGADVSAFIMKHDTYIQADNAAASATNLIKLDTNDEIAFGVDVGGLIMKHDTYIQADNAAASPINLIKVNTSDKLAIGIDLANAAIVNNVSLQHRNAADNAYIETLKVNGSDLIEVGANIVAANVATLGTSLIDTLSSAVTLADNQAATDATVVTISAGESAAVHYRIVRNSVIQSGILRFTYGETIPSESYTGTDVGVTFTAASGVLKYATTSTGNTGSMTYVVIKE